MLQKSIVMIVALSFLFSLSCDLTKKPAPWTATLNENTIYSLQKPLGEIKKHLDAIEKFQKQGMRKKATEEMTMLRQKLDMLQNYTIPLLNAKAHLTNAYNYTMRKELSNAEEELKTIRSLLFSVKTKASANTVKEINSLNLELENLEKELSNVSKTAHERFVSIAQKLDTFINSNTKM